MSVTLWNDAGEINFANANFRRLLELAREYGWNQPLSVDDVSLVGDLSDTSAEEFGLALEAAIAELPTTRNVWEETGGVTGARVIGPNENVSNLTWFGGQSARLAEVVRICKAGTVSFS